jgi:hypothetical protein
LLIVVALPVASVFGLVLLFLRSRPRKDSKPQAPRSPPAPALDFPRTDLPKVVLPPMQAFRPLAPLVTSGELMAVLARSGADRNRLGCASDPAALVSLLRTLRRWVEDRHGQWDHADWLALLESLQGSLARPAEPEQIGQLLEEFKRDWQRARS